MILLMPPVLQEPPTTPDAGALLEEARELRSQKKWSEAVAIYSRMLEIWKDHQLALFDRGQTLSWMKQFEASRRDLKRHREVYPELAASTDPVLARVTAWSKHFKEAVAILKPYVHLGDRQATLDTATFLSWDGQWSRSLSLAQGWLQAHPGDRDFQVLVGRVAGWSGQHKRARLSYEHILKEAPKDRAAVLGLAQLDLWAGDPDAAAARIALLNPDDTAASETQLVVSQIDQRLGRLRKSRSRALAVEGDPEVQEDAQSRLRDLAEAQGPWVELSQTRTDSNDGLRSQVGRIDGSLPLFDGSLRVGGAFNFLEQPGQPDRRPEAWMLGLNFPLGTCFTTSAQVGRFKDPGSDPATPLGLALGWRIAPALNLSLSQTLDPNLATPKAVSLHTSTRTWGLGASWGFNQTLDHLGGTVERALLPEEVARTGFRGEAGHRFPMDGGEWRAGVSTRWANQSRTLDLGFFNPQRYRYYGLTAGGTLSQEGRWELTLDAWGGRQTVNQDSSQFSWGYTLAGSWSPGPSFLTLFASWSQSVAGLPIADPIDPSNYRDHTARFGLRLRGNRKIW